MLQSLRKTVFGLALCGLALTAHAIPFQTWTNHLLGDWQPGSGYNSDADVPIGANKLINWYNDNVNPNPDANATFHLTAGSAVPLPDLPSPATFGYKDDTAPFGTVNPTVTKYVLGKYGNTSYLFYLGNVDPGNYSLPSSYGGNGLSHVVSFDAISEAPGVPDGGSTIALLGACMLFLESLRRKFRRG